MKADCTKWWKSKTAYVISEKNDPCRLYRHGLQKQFIELGVVLNEVTLSAHSLIFSSLNTIVRTIEKVKFNALLKQIHLVIIKNHEFVKIFGFQSRFWHLFSPSDPIFKSDIFWLYAVICPWEWSCFQRKACLNRPSKMPI